MSIHSFLWLVGCLGKALDRQNVLMAILADGADSKAVVVKIAFEVGGAQFTRAMRAAQAAGKTNYAAPPEVLDCRS
jgi:hypothetical protein